MQKEKVEIKKFKLTGRDLKKRKLELSFEQRAQRKELRLIDKEDVSKAKSKFDPKTIRRVTVDSVFDTNNYRLLVAKFKPDAKIEDILLTKSWKTEYDVLVEGEKIEAEEKDPLLNELTLDKREIDEGRVFLFIDGFKTEITKSVKEDAKELYRKVASKMRRRRK
jgi:hypothetical protein